MPTTTTTIIIVGEVDRLGYVYCAECHPQALTAGQMNYPVAIYADSCDGDEVCESCHQPLSS